MKLYRITASAYGIRLMSRDGKRDLCGLSTFAMTNLSEALRRYNQLKKELKDYDYRMRLELVEVPDRLTIADWIEFLETETISRVEVIECIRIESNRRAA